MKVTNGTVTQLADITSAITGGTTYAAKIEKTGSTYKVYRNNVLLATATDSTWASGKVGLGTLSDGATFDNLVVTAASTLPPGYYVDPVAGSMSNPGTAAAPWSTLQAVFAAGKTFAAGDVIYLRSGNHGFPVISSDNTGNVTITKQAGHDPVINRIDFNSASRWVIDGVKINTTAIPPDPRPLTHPVYPVYNNSLVRVTNGSNNITFKNCTVYSATSISTWTANDWNTKSWEGFYINGASNFVTIDACTVRNVNFAIHMNGDTHHLTIKNSLVENYCGDGLRATGSDLLIEYNTIRDVYATNGNHYDIIQGFGSARVTIRGNVLLNTTSNRSFMHDAQAIGAFDGWFDDWVVENNIVASGHWHGITLLGARNCRVVNNTVVKNPFSTSSATPWIQIGAHKDGTASSGNYCRNNLTSDINTMSGTTVSNNIETTAYTSHFVNYAGLNFHLKTGAPSINAGTTSQAPTIDFEKQARVSPYDVGADEF
jgi:parallel beta-helix repeat protein